MTACADIHKRLQPFLNDLLSDHEFKEFVAHTEDCAACLNYVRSIGEISNQVWKLGDVSVPKDFHQTVLYKVSQQKPTVLPEPAIASQKIYFICLLVFLVILFVGLILLAQNKKEAQKPLPIHQTGETSQLLQDLISEAEMEQTSLEKAAVPASLRVEKIAPKEEVPPMKQTQDPPAEVVQKRSALHWHLIYSTGNITEAQARRQKLAFLRGQTLEIEQLESEIRRLEAQIPLNDAGAEEARRSSREKLKQLDEKSEEVKSEIEKLEKLFDNEPKKIDPERWFSDTLNNLGIRFENVSPNVFTLLSSGKNMQTLTEKIISQEFSSLHEFTPPLSPKSQSEQASVYIDLAGRGSLHWHVSGLPKDGKEELLKDIRDLGGSIQEKADNLFLLSISRAQVKTLDIRIQAKHATLTEFGRLEEKKSILGDVPVSISLFFFN